MVARNAFEDLATEATLAARLSEATFTAEDFATEASLAAALVVLGTIDADTSLLAIKDFATQATLATRLSEATFVAEDFATQTTLASLLTQVLLAVAKLNDIFGAVDGLEISADNIDISNTTIGLSVDTLEALLQQIRDNAILEDFASEATVEAIRALLAGPLAVTGTFWQATQAVSATDLDIRALALTQDNVRQTARPMAPFHAVLAAGTSDQILVTAPDRLRILRIDGGCKPSTADGVYPSYAINLDVGNGDEIIRGKELQAGEPLGCTVCFEGVAGADLTVAVTGAGGVVEFDIAYEVFQ